MYTIACFMVFINEDIQATSTSFHTGVVSDTRDTLYKGIKLHCDATTLGFHEKNYGM